MKPGLQQINTNLNVPGGRGVGGLGTSMTIANLLQPLTDKIAEEAIRGAQIVTGGNPYGPKVASVGTTDFDVSTPEGQAGFNKALKAQKGLGSAIDILKNLPEPRVDVIGQGKIPAAQAKPANLGPGVTTIQGIEYNDNDPAQVKAKNDHLARLNEGAGPMADLRGGAVKKATPNQPAGNNGGQQPAPAQARSNMADATELERYKKFVEANKDIARQVKPGQAGYEEIQIALGRMPFMPDEVQFGKLQDNPLDAAKKAGITDLYDGQVTAEEEKTRDVAQQFAADRLGMVSQAMQNAGFETPALKSSAMTMEFRDANGNGTDDRFESIPNAGFGAGSGAANFNIDPRLMDRMKDMGLIRGYEHRMYVKD